MRFSRVLITGDVLRPFPVGAEWESATWKNVRWLSEILSPALRACGMDITTLSWDDRAPPTRNHRFDTPSIYQDVGQDLGLQSWARLTRQAQAPDALVAALRVPTADALVVGYEMPEVMVDALHRLERPFIDVILHPVRFMPDLVFALRTNVPGFHRRFESLRLADAEIEQQASLIRAKAAWMPPPAQLPPGTVLLLGQVGIDRAMVTADGRFASFEDHLDALHGLCCDHPLVLFKPHPYALGDDASRRAVSRFPAIATVRDNFYHLLAQPEVEGVVALNSSGLHEARMFGRWSRNLIPELYEFRTSRAPGSGGPGNPVPVSSVWTRPAFWRGLLDRSDRPIADADLAACAPNTLRRAMNADWGYGFIERICA